MHGWHQLCKESQYTEAKQVQRQVPLWVWHLPCSVKTKAMYIITASLHCSLFYYSTDSTGHIHLSGKAGHQASKASGDYYNATFLDVSCCIFCCCTWFMYTLEYVTLIELNVLKKKDVKKWCYFSWTKYAACQTVYAILSVHAVQLAHLRVLCVWQSHDPVYTAAVCCHLLIVIIWLC